MWREAQPEIKIPISEMGFALFSTWNERFKPINASASNIQFGRAPMSDWRIAARTGKSSFRPAALASLLLSR